VILQKAAKKSRSDYMNGIWVTGKTLEGTRFFKTFGFAVMGVENNSE
jgi:hypothetical protein